MRCRLLLTLIGCLFLGMSLTAQASMKDFCAKRWHDNAAMQAYCLDVQDQSTVRLAKLLDILDATYERMSVTGSHPLPDVAQNCSRQHYLKVFDAYHNQLVEACIVQYLDGLQRPRTMYQQQVQVDY